MNNYNQLLQKIDRFIRKYYLNKLIKGSLVSIIIISFIYLSASLTEYFGHFSTIVRTVIFYSFITLFALVFSFYVILPAINLLRIGKIISYKKASNIIVKFFPEIKDKLLNSLELHELNQDQNNVLIEAAIDQKINEINIFSFRKAINLKLNYKYLKYLAVVFIVIFTILAFSPAVLTESNYRIVNHTKYYEKPSPFKFLLINEDLQTKKGEDFTVNLKVVGNEIPSEIFIEYTGNTFMMLKKPKSNTEFSYEFKNLNNSLKFNFTTDEYDSQKYNLKVLPTPVILNFKLIADVPSYTGEEDKQYENTGDIVVPYGTRLTWSFSTKDVDSLQFISEDSKILLNKSESVFSFRKRVMKNYSYSISVANEFFKNEKLIDYQISVIPDLYPAISVEELKDTSNFFVNYYNGIINDDYGIKNLTFNYRIVQEGTSQTHTAVKYKTINLRFIPAQLKQNFFYTFDFSSIEVQKEQIVQYFFRVWDNDAITGSKSARTSIYEFRIPAYEELKELENLASENIKSTIDQSMNLAQDLQNELKKFREKTLNGEMTQWEKTQMLQNILDKQDLLQKLMKEASQENKSKNEMQRNFTKQDKELLEKQKELEKLMDELMTDELKELMKQIQELQMKFDEKMMNKMMDENKFSYDEMTERLDRSLELLKRYEIEQKIDNTINELKELSEKQQKLSKETENKKSDKEDLLQKQKDIEERFKNVKKDYEKANELNNKLKDKMNLDEFKEEFNEIEKEFKESKENLDKNKKNKASKSQKQNSKNMKDAARKMQQMMEQNMMQQQSEDLESLRQIVDNLLSFSFAQEDLENKFSKVTFRDPKYIDYNDRQLTLSDDFDHIKDSLKTLSERIVQISKPIQDEVRAIEKNLKKAVTNFEERKFSSGKKRQREIMTSANNLALLLSEILNQMQNSMQSSGSGKSGNQKKNGKKQAFQSLKKQQEGLKKQMQRMLQQMKDGKGQFNKSAQNKQLAKMLAQQEIFRQMLKEMRAKHSLSPETQKLLNEINKMAEQNEKDLVNKKITPRLLQRQKKITTRLLEAEKAENKRKTDSKRESKEAREKKYKSAEDYFKKKENKQSFKENLYRNNLKLRNFYKNLNEDYSNKIRK